MDQEARGDPEIGKVETKKVNQCLIKHVGEDEDKEEEAHFKEYFVSLYHNYCYDLL